METTQTTLDCGHEPSPHEPFTTGYGTNPDGKRHCYECCAERERATMVETGKATLYLVAPPSDYMKPLGNAPTGWEVTDWPGHLRFKVATMRKGRHNMARTRYDAWFRGPDGQTWHGVQYGENTQIIHCRRVKP